ncbi:MAG: chemotaxis protein [Rhodocyclaceae bacterium]|nr:MAG: chemotaxis protein [Rhodocyclaceae bacterium]
MTIANQRGQQLRHIVGINEEIKKVIATAFIINLTAMNAIFLAKRASTVALGFGVLSKELRRFAIDLQKQMAMLSEMTYESVSTVTALLKQARLNQMLERTMGVCSGLGKSLVEDALDSRLNGFLADRQEQSDAVNHRLSEMIADTVQLVELGSVLARSARIEAAYGGKLSVSLTQVSSDFELSIGEIQGSLEKLTKHQFEESAA